MKKMNYEAPKAEVIEMSMPVVLTESAGLPSSMTSIPSGPTPPGS
jgi:hypothetical protein